MLKILYQIVSFFFLLRIHFFLVNKYIFFLILSNLAIFLRNRILKNIYLKMISHISFL